MKKVSKKKGVNLHFTDEDMSKVSTAVKDLGITNSEFMLLAISDGILRGFEPVTKEAPPRSHIAIRIPDKMDKWLTKTSEKNGLSKQELMRQLCFNIIG